jgi:tRNA threonylcarbamoyl adenosine modification protein YeaZ
VTVDPLAGLVLALEGSTRVASVAAGFHGRTLSSDLDGERVHQSDLLPAIDALVTELGAKPRDLAAVVVGTGPGSYTGLRVAIATALGLARASGARLLGVPSGEAACFGACGDGNELALLLDARSGELYFGRWRRVGREVEQVEAARVARPADVPDLRLDGAIVLTDVPTQLAPHQIANVRADARPHARALLELGTSRLARGIETPADRLEPLYLRAFVATERKR